MSTATCKIRYRLYGRNMIILTTLSPMETPVKPLEFRPVAKRFAKAENALKYRLKINNPLMCIEPNHGVKSPIKPEYKSTTNTPNKSVFLYDKAQNRAQIRFNVIMV
jgi:hypothetical protein